jgi:alpha-beta hydrolase superfamily lysophospholipase
LTVSHPTYELPPDESFRFASNADGMRIEAYAWRTDSPRAIIVIAHGAAEHALRYGRFARALNEAHIDVWAVDHRGHGQTAGVDKLGDLGEGGWDAVVADIGQLISMAHDAHPGLPVVLFGHSMGGSVAQQFAPDGSESIAALILSGSTAVPVPREGDPPRIFEPNKGFEPARTPYDWLSRDEAEVDKYVADPFCGFETQVARRPGGQRSVPSKLSDPQRLRRIRPDLPCLFVAGDADPVNRRLEGLRQLEQWWRDAGVRHISTIYYPGARHEILMETNRDEVTADIIGWIRGVLCI